MQSVTLTIVGMLVVFIFMCLLTVFLKLFIIVAFRLLPDRETAKAASVAVDFGKGGSEDEKVVAAIAAALAAGGENTK